MKKQHCPARLVRVVVAGSVAGLMLAGCAATPRTATGSNRGSSADRSDPACVMDNVASRIRPNGPPCSAVGRSYSSDDIGRTGATTTGQALQLLDPSITVSH